MGNTSRQIDRVERDLGVACDYAVSCCGHCSWYIAAVPGHGTFSDSTTQDVSYQVTWSSSSPNVAVVTATGLATSTGVGATTVKAAGNINENAATNQVLLTVH